MKATHYALPAILVAVGAISIIWGSRELYSVLTADELERIVFENSLGVGNGPELFALRFVGIGLLALVAAWLEWRYTSKKNGRRSA